MKRCTALLYLVFVGHSISDVTGIIQAVGDRRETRHKNYYIERIEYNKTYREYIDSFIQANKVLPDECRRDYCPEVTELNDEAGKLAWKTNQLGQRCFHRCPYDCKDNSSCSMMPRYASKDCILDNQTSIWLETNSSNCPRHIISRELQKITGQMNAEMRQTGSLSQKSLQTSIRKLYEQYSLHKTFPVLAEDIRNMETILAYLVDSHIQSKQHISKDIGERALFICNRYLHKSGRILRLVVQITNLIEKDQSLPFIKDGMMFKVINVTTMKRRMFLSNALIGNLSIGFKNASIHRDSSVYLNKGMVRRRGNVLVLYTADQVTSKHSTTLQSDTESATLQWAIQHNAMESPITHSIGTELHSVSDEDHIAATSAAHISLNRTKVVMLSSTVYLNFISQNTIDAPNEVDVNVTFKFEETNGSLVCAQWIPKLNETKGNDTQWTPCQSTLLLKRKVRCRCRHMGYYGVFGRSKPAAAGPRPDLSEFLGFPYVEEVYILANILRPVSMICLILTILTYVLFRNLRRGPPTYILVHLCVSLVILDLLLYVSEAVGETKTGCRFANASRLYIVLVSLSWNGVEAINMYLMLIKVFAHDIDRFVLKAAIVAWGAPLLLVVLLVLIDTSALDGEHIVIDSGKCAFSCKLKRNTMILTYLLPMLAIVIHNIVVFALVTKAIKKNRKHLGTTTQKKTQVLGAVTLLVLLGIPWLASAFAAIATAKSADMGIVDGIALVIFTIFINAQGTFIFYFHCARLPDVRSQWLAVLPCRKDNTPASSESKNTKVPSASSVSGSRCASCDRDTKL